MNRDDFNANLPVPRVELVNLHVLVMSAFVVLVAMMDGTARLMSAASRQLQLVCAIVVYLPCVFIIINATLQPAAAAAAAAASALAASTEKQ